MPRSPAASPSGRGGGSTNRRCGSCPASLSLILFAWLLTLADTNAAGRAYAAYGGIYIAASLAWLWLAEGVRPDRWDMAGAAICIAGASVILFAPRAV